LVLLPSLLAGVGAGANELFPKTGPALATYEQFLQSLSDRNFPVAYPLLDEVSQAYLGCCYDIVKEIKAKVDASPGKFPPEQISTLQLMFSAKDPQALFAILMERFFPQISSEEFARLRCFQITPLSPNAYRLTTVNGKAFLIVNQKDAWKIDLSDHFLALYNELTDTKELLERMLNSE